MADLNPCINLFQIGCSSLVSAFTIGILEFVGVQTSSQPGNLQFP